VDSRRERFTTCTEYCGKPSSRPSAGNCSRATRPISSSRPKVERKQMNVLDADAAAEMIEAARGTALFVPVLLGVLLGLRRGEIAAVRWRSVALDAGQLAVVASAEQTGTVVREKETQSGKCRTVALPSLIVDELRRHRIEQAQQLLRLGVRLTDEHHVVTCADGRPLKPDSLTQEFVHFIKANKLRRVRFHDLCHAHATHLLVSGVHPKVVSERLGHSKVGITLDLYSHVLPGMQADAAAKVDDAMRAAIQKRNQPFGG
jgi:integrase